MSLRASTLRRVTACVLALSFGLYTAEALLADTHDGDATHEELARVDGSHPDSLSHAPANHPGERDPGESGHEQHACHCSHVHSGWSQASSSRDASLELTSVEPIAFREQSPASRRAEPQFRPPIG